MFEFTSVIAQVAEDNILTSVVSIVVSLGIILPIVGKYVSGMHKSLRPVGQYTDAFGQKTAELTDDLYILADAIKHTAPEAETYIKEKYGKNLTYFRGRVSIAEQQATRFKSKLEVEDPELLADSVKDLPRESFSTKSTSTLPSRTSATYREDEKVEDN